MPPSKSHYIIEEKMKKTFVPIIVELPSGTKLFQIIAFLPF